MMSELSPGEGLNTGPPAPTLTAASNGFSREEINTMFKDRDVSIEQVHQLLVGGLVTTLVGLFESF